MQRTLKRHGPVSEMTFLGKRWTALIGPQACEVAFRNADKAFANGPGWGELVGPFFDRGLMLLDFAEHHQHRRIMQGAFTRDRLRGYTGALQGPIRRTVEAWPQAERFEIYPAIKSATLDIATQVFMGGADLAGPAELARVNNAFTDCVQAATALVRRDIPGTKWRRALKGRRLLEDFLRRHVARRRAVEGDDLFSVLCHLRDDDGEAFSDTDVVNHMIFLLMAAHDTSTSTATTMIQLLGQHPDWQERCRAEALRLPDNPTLDDLDTAIDLDLAMREALRLVPPVPVVARYTVKDTQVLGVRVPAGRFVVVALHLNHHQTELWTEPSKFDPDRFAEPRREDTHHRHAWDPFGGGVHKCLGMFFAKAEVLSLMTHLLRTRRWHIDPNYRAPLSYTSLPYPKDGLPVRLMPFTREVSV
ncbi:P450 heme-thiolate protein [Hoyosella subflava DQS3-9A1]|uniref:P450 heme-thiolate protein n=2 Tax=Hoyosella TaxID=697025 RepID=F6ENI6_HOYSD|nr:P450 heme-thiolate protein [Hoyosella subflava DQS3-9A1]